MRYKSSRYRAAAEINVTPFVDVMLVLLIVFMIAPLLTKGVEVNLPRTRTVEALPRDSDHVVLTVDAQGNMFLDDYQVEQGKLRERVLIYVVNQEKQLYLQADKELDYGKAVQIMTEVKNAGVTRLGIVSEEDEENELAPLP